ncbi:MAG: c-type cytochrome [Gaiellaceae bacterium]
MSFRPLALSLVGAALLLAGCGGEEVTSFEDANEANGQALFAVNCSRCHTLADAATVSEIGPNLDQAFGYACRQGFDESTFFEVVRSQIDIPGRNSQMPADLVTGQDAADVAAYVASVAGKNIPGCGETTTGETTTAAQG